MLRHDIEVIIPPKTVLKMLIRGITDLSFIGEIIKDAKQVQDGKKRRLRVNGLITYYTKHANQIIVLSTYLVGREDEVVDKRIRALFGLLIN